MLRANPQYTFTILSSSITPMNYCLRLALYLLQAECDGIDPLSLKRAKMPPLPL